jgi:hypothetical protein
MRIVNAILSWFRGPEKAPPVIMLGPSGFSVTDDDRELLRIDWASVLKVVAFKDDLWAYDEICLGFRVVEADSYQIVTESYIGYEE